MRRPSTSLSVLVVLAAIALLVGGAVEVVTAVTTRHEGRSIQGALGAVAIVAAIVTLAWPRPTVHLFAVIAGVALVAIGILQLVEVRRANAALKRLMAT
jgi:uncharacterized membrane protein HdeD (DUF308 family)